MIPKQLILDPCCGSRMFWFDKKNPLATFGDIRQEDNSFKDRDKTRTCKIDPDVVIDFRDMPFEDKSFKLVVFDPPHLTSLGKTSWMAKKYGVLNKETWRDDIKKGFDECWRVLEDNGVLIFKWNESQIKRKDVLEVIEREPLFGHPTNSKNSTHWFCFMKSDTYILEGKNDT